LRGLSPPPLSIDSVMELLREGAAGVRAEQVTRSSWIEYDSENNLNVNLDGEPTLLKQFRVECRQHALPVRLGENHLCRAITGGLDNDCNPPRHLQKRRSELSPFCHSGDG
jgi:hypothetical protein